jgi:predicted secreted protein
MSLAFALAIYFIIWWIVLFAMLPIGVHTTEEEGQERPAGFAESAPHRPQLLPKMLATTVVAAIVFAGVYAIIVHHVITLDDIPFFPRYDPVQQAS